MTLQEVLARIADWLDRDNSPVDIGEFVRSFGLHDIEAGQLLMRAFDARLLRGRLSTNLVEFHGHISGFADDTRPVWH